MNAVSHSQARDPRVHRAFDQRVAFLEGGAGPAVGIGDRRGVDPVPEQEGLAVRLGGDRADL